MRGRKKVNNFFINKKIPFSERRKIPLLLFGDRIAWVGGLRSDQEMAATQDTKEILKVELTSLSE
jgi:tRNA(Ile)-lysidine synthase